MPFPGGVKHQPGRHPLRLFVMMGSGTSLSAQCDVSSRGPSLSRRVAAPHCAPGGQHKGVSGTPHGAANRVGRPLMAAPAIVQASNRHLKCVGALTAYRFRLTRRALLDFFAPTNATRALIAQRFSIRSVVSWFTRVRLTPHVWPMHVPGSL
jgi:hypothetical protein